ncbi:MAG: peptide chain release factor-like protein, partial [Patescibacteria group bacterium]
QTERSQAQNKEKALTLLTSRLAVLMEQSKVSELSQLKPELKSGSVDWGSQIRSYVLHPYQMVKDHRTGVKSSQPEKVLEGDLSKFILS